MFGGSWSVNLGGSQGSSWSVRGIERAEMFHGSCMEC